MLFHRKNSLDSLGAIGQSKETIEPEEIFSDSSFVLDTDKYSSYEQEKKLEVPMPRYMPIFMQLATFAIFSSLFFYIVYLNFGQDGKYTALAARNAERTFTLQAPRGDILDDKGNILATSISGFDVELRSKDISATPEQISALARALSKSDDGAKMIESRINDATQKNMARVILARNIPIDEVDAIQKQIQNFSGITIREHPMRYYPYGPYTAHVLGYTSSITPDELGKYNNSTYAADDQIGKDGLELNYESELRGAPGLAANLVNAQGRTLGEQVISQPQKGATLHTTIDIDLQKISYDILSAALKEKNLKAGSVVAIDPRNGAVKTLVSLPSFDPNSFVQGINSKEYDTLINKSSDPLLDRAIGGVYPSGSVIKPLIAAAALQERVIDPNKVMETHGFITVPSVYDPSVIYTFVDWKNHGPVDMRKAIAVSSDVYFYTIGGGYMNQKGLGISRIDKYLEIFNWGLRTGIDLPGEEKGFVPSPQWKKQSRGEDWFIGDTYHTSIGQGDVLSTPLQVAASISSIANDGTYFTPHLVTSVQDTIVNWTQRVLPFSSQIYRVAQEGMRMAVTSGSSQSLKVLPFEMAGKTGTAQATGSDNHAWFVGYAPYDNPKLVILVIIEKGMESTEAVHVTRDILQKYEQIRPLSTH